MSDITCPRFIRITAIKTFGQELLLNGHISVLRFKLTIGELDIFFWANYCPTIEMSKVENGHQSYVMQLKTNCDALTWFFLSRINYPGHTVLYCPPFSHSDCKKASPYQLPQNKNI